MSNSSRIRKIAIFSGSRADASPLAPLIAELQGKCEIHEIKTQGLFGHESYIKERLEAIRPHTVIILGDRYESLVCATVCALLCIPICHLSGGDVTYGANDDSFRHAITKLAYWHFPVCGLHAKRIIQMGESPDRVFPLGAPAVDLLAQPIMSREECEAELGIKLESPVALVLHHPETLGNDNLAEVKRVASPYKTIIISGANDDIGGEAINTHWCDLVRAPDVVFRESYPQKLWLSLMHHADALIGNSSGFIVEGMTLRAMRNYAAQEDMIIWGKGYQKSLKIIILGSRQAGRYEDALRLFSQESYPFGKPGEVSTAIADKILSLEIPEKPVKIWHGQS